MAKSIAPIRISEEPHPIGVKGAGWEPRWVMRKQIVNYLEANCTGEYSLWFDEDKTPIIHTVKGGKLVCYTLHRAQYLTDKEMQELIDNINN